MRIKLDEEAQPEIGLVALIDCIFFLLMFFMVATSFKQQETGQKEKSLALVLPTASVTLNKAAADDALVIEVDVQGRFYIDGNSLSPQGLTERLVQERKTRPALRVRIDGDRRTSYQNIVHVLDLCQFEGITGVAVRVRD